MTPVVHAIVLVPVELQTKLAFLGGLLLAWVAFRNWEEIEADVKQFIPRSEQKAVILPFPKQKYGAALPGINNNA